MARRWNGKTLREILAIHSQREFYDWLPRGAEDLIAAFSVAVWLLTPALMAVLAVRHPTLDYVFFTHPKLIHRYVFPASVLLAALACVLTAGRMRQAGARLGTALRHRPIHVLFLLLSVWMVASTTANGWSGSALFGEYVREETVFSQLCYFLVLFPTASLLRSERGKRWLLRLHLLVSCVLVAAAFVLWDIQTASTLFYDWHHPFAAIYTNVNYYSYYLSLSVPLAAALFAAEEKPAWQAFAAAALAANAAALGVNRTMGGWVACFFAAVFLIVTYRIVDRKVNRRTLIAAAILLICFLIPAILTGNLQKNAAELLRDLGLIARQAEEAGHAGSGRWGIWKRTVALIVQHPLFGIGFEGIYVRDLSEYLRQTRPHNEYLQYALFYGIPAGLLYLSGCFGVFLRALKHRARLDRTSLACLTAAFGYLVSAFFGNTIFCTAPLLFLFLGMGCGGTHNGDTDQTI